MEIRELTCIRCPLGCQLKVTIEEDEINVTGNSCGRGIEYGKKEVLSPTRMVTSSVRVLGENMIWFLLKPVRTFQRIRYLTA